MFIQFSACRLRAFYFQRDQPPASLNEKLILSKMRSQHERGFEKFVATILVL